MNIVCLDMEGVLVPEIWIEFSKKTGISELTRTTRDEPDYDKLMHWRLGILREHGLGLKEIQDVIAQIDPLPGAKEFLDELRKDMQVIIISDTFTQFAMPLMAKLGYPTIMCNELVVAENGEVTGFKMRCEKSKLTTVKALQSIGYDTIASGDSFNDGRYIVFINKELIINSLKIYKNLENFPFYGELLKMHSTFKDHLIIFILVCNALGLDMDDVTNRLINHIPLRKPLKESLKEHKDPKEVLFTALYQNMKRDWPSFTAMFLSYKLKLLDNMFKPEELK